MVVLDDLVVVVLVQVIEVVVVPDTLDVGRCRRSRGGASRRDLRFIELVCMEEVCPVDIMKECVRERFAGQMMALGTFGAKTREIEQPAR